MKNPYSNALRVKKLPLQWNVLGKILDPKKKSPHDGALLEFKKGGEPCDCRELLIIIIFVVLSLHGNQNIPYVKSHLLYFSNKNLTTCLV